MSHRPVAGGGAEIVSNPAPRPLRDAHLVHSHRDAGVGMSTHVSASTASWPALGARTTEGGAAQRVRSTSWRLYGALALGSLLLGALSLLYPSTPSYDPWGWLLWGREILHLDLNTRGANSFKPLPILFTLPLSLFGKAQPDLWLMVARAGALFTFAMAFRLAARITIWLGATPAGRTGLARVLAYGPAVLAGAVAAITILMSTDFLRDVMLGYSEALAVGMVLLAIDRHLEGSRRQAFAVAFFAALDRPEIWPFWGLYGLYLWWRDPGAAKLVIGLFVLVPVLWFVPEYWGSGQFFRGVNHALHPQAGQATYARCPFCSELKEASQDVVVRSWAVAIAVAAGAAAVIANALRRRTGELATAAREQARSAAGIVLALAVGAVAWFVEISLMTQMGFGGNKRYLVIGGALVSIVGGVGWGVGTWMLGRLLGGLIRPAAGAAVAVVLATGVFLFVPVWVGTRLHTLGQALHYQAALRRDLNKIIGRAGGAHAVLACGKVETENYQVQMVAWYLGVAGIVISDEMPPSVARTQANVILQTRDTGTAALRPLIPAGVRYKEITQGKFHLYEHCR
jgi:hypothetical protein